MCHGWMAQQFLPIGAESCVPLVRLHAQNQMRGTLEGVNGKNPCSDGYTLVLLHSQIRVLYEISWECSMIFTHIVFLRGSKCFFVSWSFNYSYFRGQLAWWLSLVNISAKALANMLNGVIKVEEPHSQELLWQSCPIILCSFWMISLFCLFSQFIFIGIHCLSYWHHAVS